MFKLFIGSFLKSSPTTFAFLFEASLVVSIINETSKPWWILTVVFFVLSLVFTKIMTEINIDSGYQEPAASLFTNNYISALISAPIIFPFNLLNFIFSAIIVFFAFFTSDK